MLVVVLVVVVVVVVVVVLVVLVIDGPFSMKGKGVIVVVVVVEVVVVVLVVVVVVVVVLVVVVVVVVLVVIVVVVVVVVVVYVLGCGALLGGVVAVLLLLLLLLPLLLFPSASGPPRSAWLCLQRSCGRPPLRCGLRSVRTLRLYRMCPLVAIGGCCSGGAPSWCGRRRRCRAWQRPRLPPSSTRPVAPAKAAESLHPGHWFCRESPWRRGRGSWPCPTTTVV